MIDLDLRKDDQRPGPEVVLDVERFEVHKFRDMSWPRLRTKDSADLMTLDALVVPHVSN